MKRRQYGVEFAVATTRHGEDELERLRADADLADGLEIVERKQPPVSHQDDPLDRVARQHLLDGRDQRRGLAGIAGEDLVVNRKAVCGLYHAEHDLAGDSAVFRQAEAAQLLGHLRAALGANRRQVVEDDRQLLIEQRAQQRRQRRFERIGTVHERVHRAQQVLMRSPTPRAPQAPAPLRASAGCRAWIRGRTGD